MGRRARTEKNVRCTSAMKEMKRRTYTRWKDSWKGDRERLKEEDSLDVTDVKNDIYNRSCDPRWWGESLMRRRIDRPTASLSWAWGSLIIFSTHSVISSGRLLDWRSSALLPLSNRNMGLSASSCQANKQGHSLHRHRKTQPDCYWWQLHRLLT